MAAAIGSSGCSSSDPGDVGGSDDNLDMNTPSCDGDSKAEVCSAFCERFCQNQVLLCYASECEPGACAAGSEIIDACMASDELADARELCTTQLDIGCEDFGREAGGTFTSSCLLHDPECVQNAELGCSNTCGDAERVGGQLAGNGVCEDGHPEDSASDACDRGTDCDDCGPHACAPPLADCTSHGDCCGYYGSGALCVAPREGSQPYCVLVCDDEHPCPDDFSCVPTSEGSAVCMLSDDIEED